MRKRETWVNPLRLSNLRRFSGYVFLACFTLLLVAPAPPCHAQPSPSRDAVQQQQGEGESGNSVMQSFNRSRDEFSLGKVYTIADKEKQEIMFIMGICLLVSVVTTASLGIAMAVYGKNVFLIHMIFGGISVFLAIAHAVVAVVWFFPF